MKSFCLKKCQSANEDEKHLQDFFAAKNNAWFINSRFINFPPRAEGLLSLLEDVDAAAKKQHKSGWKFDNILLVVMRLYPKTTNEDMHKEILYRKKSKFYASKKLPYHFQYLKYTCSFYEVVS